MFSNELKARYPTSQGIYYINNSGHMGGCQFFEHKSVHECIKVQLLRWVMISKLCCFMKEVVVMKDDSDTKH